MVRGKLESGFDRVVNGISDGLDWLHQSFGEVNAISREPNGHLYVDFRKAEVAETVCRARTSPTCMALTSVRLLGMSFAGASLYQGCRQRLLILLHGQEALSRFVISA